MLELLPQFEHCDVDIGVALLNLGAVSGVQLVVKDGHIYKESQSVTIHNVLPGEADIITTCKMRQMVNRGCRGCDIPEGRCKNLCISFKVKRPCDIEYYENENEEDL